MPSCGHEGWNGEGDSEGDDTRTLGASAGEQESERAVKVKGTRGVREVKEGSPSRKCQTLQCAGLVVTPKLASRSVYVQEMGQWHEPRTCGKLQRMWPLMRIGEKEVVKKECREETG
jgi:hypothetical protein